MADEKPGLNFDGRPVDGGAIRIVPNKVLTDQQLRDLFNAEIQSGAVVLPKLTPELEARGQRWSDNLFARRDAAVTGEIVLDTEIAATRAIANGLTPDSVVTPEGKPVGFKAVEDLVKNKIDSIRGWPR